MDVAREVGESWDIAKRIFYRPQREAFEDIKFKSFIYDLREVNPNEDDFMRALAIQLDYVTVGVNNLLDHWEFIIFTHRNGTFRVSVDSFKSLSLTEIWVVRNKIRRISNLNELIRDRLRDYANHNSPQVIRNPYYVKFINENHFGTFYLDHDSLSTYGVNQ